MPGAFRTLLAGMLLKTVEDCAPASIMAPLLMVLPLSAMALISILESSPTFMPAMSLNCQKSDGCAGATMCSMNSTMLYALFS